MKTRRLGLLFAAATLAAIPAAVQAQDHGGWQGRHGDGGRPVGAGRGEGPRSDRPDGPRGPRPEAPASAPAAQPAPSAPTQSASRFDAGRQARAADYARQQGGRDRGFDGNWSRGQGPGRRDFDRPVPPVQGWRGRPPGPDRAFSGSGNRGDDHHRYVEIGRDNRGFDNRGAWQRNWRNDGRYDWQGWRTRNRGLFRSPRYIPPRGYGFGYRLFSPGYRLDPFFYDQGYWLANPWDYRLPPAYGPYRWVRYYNDVLLVDITRGVVVDVIRDFFW